MLCGSHIMQHKLDCEVHVSITHVNSQNTHTKKSLSSAMAHKKEPSQYSQILGLDYHMNGRGIFWQVQTLQLVKFAL